MGFEKFSVIHKGADHVFHVIGPVGAVRNHGIQGRIHAGGIIFRGHERRVLHIVGRQVGQERFHLDDAVLIRFTGKLGHPGFFIVGHGPAQVFKGYLFTGDGLDHVRAGDEHITAFLDHENEIGHGG